MAELNHLIQYRCIRPVHLRVKVKERVFVHRSGWAYCTAGRDADHHEFLPTGGLERRGLEQRMRSRESSG